LSVAVTRRRSTADDWREYELLHTLHRFYLELAVRVAGGYFLIVGGVLTLVLANSAGEPIVIAALVVPLAMSVSSFSSRSGSVAGSLSCETGSRSLVGRWVSKWLPMSRSLNGP